MGRHVWLRLNLSFLLKLSGCNRISIASFTRRSMYLVAVPNLVVPSKLIHTSDPDDDDRNGCRNVGSIRTPNVADSPRRLYQI
jgi:hypothetical protein